MAEVAESVWGNRFGPVPMQGSVPGLVAVGGGGEGGQYTDGETGITVSGGRPYIPGIGPASSPSASGIDDAPDAFVGDIYASPHAFARGLKQADKVMELGRTLLNFYASLNPFANGMMAYTGKGIYGEKLSRTDRLFAMGGMVSGFGGMGRHLKEAEELAEGAEAVLLPRGGTYKLVEKETGRVMRTGRTNNLARRRLEHLRHPALGKYEFEIDRRTDSYAAQRGREQIIHREFDPPLDKVAPIHRKNPRLPHYMREGEKL